jgi:hypothetical protein
MTIDREWVTRIPNYPLFDSIDELFDKNGESLLKLLSRRNKKPIEYGKRKRASNKTCAKCKETFPATMDNFNYEYRNGTVILTTCINCPNYRGNYKAKRRS